MTDIPPSVDRDLPPGRHRALREHLMREITAEQPAPARSRWRRPVFLAPVAAAAVSVALVVGVSVTRDASPSRPAPQVSPTRTSAQSPTWFLDSAALAIERWRDVPTSDAQFLYIEREDYHWKMDPDRKLPAGCADTSEGYPSGVLELWQSVDGEHVGLRREHRRSGGTVDQPIAEQRPGKELPTSYRQAERDLPTDVPGMDRWLRTAGSGDAAAFTRATQLLDSGLLPPRVTATVLRALARIPGLVVLDGAKDAAGRSGPAVALDMADGTRAELHFDRESRMYRGSSVVENSAPANECDILRPGDLVRGTAILGRGIVDTPGKAP